MNDNGLLDTIAALHEAATGDAGQWPAAFDRVSDLMGGSGMLIGRLPHCAGAFDLAGHRIDPEIVSRINGPLASRAANPLFCAVPRAPVLRPVIASAAMDEKVWISSRAFNEAMRPAGLRYCIAGVLASNESGSYALAFGRDAASGDYGRDDARRFAAIGVHILGAVRAEERFATLRSEASVLDLLDRGVAALDQQGRVLFMNREAERILSAGDGLRIGRTGIEATLSSEERKLRTLLHGSQETLVTARALPLERPSGAEPYSVLVALYAASAHPLPALASRPHRIVFLRDGARLAEPRRDWLIQLYGLTGAQAEVALDLHAGLTPAEIAERRGNSSNTIKTHMKAVFAKTGVARQSELVGAITRALGDLRLTH